MKIGLIGLQNSGKTTIFNALTNSDIEVTSYQAENKDPNISIINVMDERITKLSKMYNPKKTIYATIESMDFVGFAAGSAQSGAFSGNVLSSIKTADALAVVTRNFNDEIVNSMNGDPDPISEIELIESEIIISDLIIAEARIVRINKMNKSGKIPKETEIEKNTLEKLIPILEDGKPLRDVELKPEEEKSLRGFQFLSQKPLMVILNSDDENFGESEDIIKKISKEYKVLEFAGKFEMELNSLDEDEVEIFMEDMGIQQSAKARLSRIAYDLLGYISFFTVGTDEVRAWTIVDGENAVAAAGTIHSDLARGFIRAECFSYDDLMEFGSEKNLRDKGKFRLEGKEYKVKDGDILNIRFNV